MREIIKKYAHDFRDMAMSEAELENMLNDVVWELWPEVKKEKNSSITSFFNIKKCKICDEPFIEEPAYLCIQIPLDPDVCRKCNKKVRKNRDV